MFKLASDQLSEVTDNHISQIINRNILINPSNDRTIASFIEEEKQRAKKAELEKFSLRANIHINENLE